MSRFGTKAPDAGPDVIGLEEVLRAYKELFTDRHAGVVQLRSTIDAIKNPFHEMWHPPQTKARGELDLFDVYVHDPRIIEVDAHARPRHYTPEHLETLRRLIARESVTSTAKSELLFQYMRNTAPAELQRRVEKKLSLEEESVELEEAERPFVFEEDQDAVTII